ncbi:hypothetical protein SEA_MERCEDES_30 [Microbacterium phage Mercedes]|nr:hypothetical protein SEA_MERCEDES_30 [Microbacterium phage Mercedes]
MGKKITLDFSKVEERSGWNTKEMPEGLHEFKIELVDLKDANDGTAMWTYGLRPVNPKYKTRLFPYYCKHQANQYFKIRDIFVAAGLTVPKKRVALDPDAPIGKIIAAEVTDASGQYAGRSEIDGVYDRSIIEDDDQVDSDDEVEEDDVDEEADEVEDDEEFDDEEEEAGDEEDDELREEIEGLTLAALRKRAKGLGIDTAGVKQADLVELVLEEELGAEEDSDEEDDLDDEDLEDEELEDEEFDDEDEEEEPEPAPRKRPAARKPAAKTAPAKAAPARRTVKRR